ncbi:MAG: outer membrane beta-barrel protein [Bacteroidota bacterium]
MDDRGANIDIVFRNGLKDYEVLPPQDAWDNIHPVIRKKQRPVAFLRAAAMFAVLISLSILAYRFSRELPSAPEGPVMAMTPESYAPEPEIILAAQPVYDVSGTGNNRPLLSDEQIVNPVATDNLNTTVSNPESTPGSDALKDNDRIGSDYLALDYRNPGYIGIEDENTLDLHDNTSRKIPNRWSISALVSPTYQSRFSSGENEAVSQVINKEQTVLSYSGGLALSFKVNRRLSIQSGLYYSSIGKELSGITAYSGFEDHFYTKGSPNFTVLTSNGSVLTSNNDIFLTDGLSAERIQTSYNNNVFDPVKSELNFLDNPVHQNFSYLELPVVLRYKVVDRVLDFNLIGGVSSNLLVNNSVNAGKTQIGTTDGMNLITFSSSIGMGMEYNLSNNLSLNLEPTFRYYINPFSNITGMNIHPYSFGVFSGISYKF